MDHKEQWNARFDTDNYVFGTAPNQFLRSEVHRLAPRSRILVVADGEGRNGVWLAEQGHKVTSVDISEVGQAKAARLASTRGVDLDLQTVSLITWDWPEAAHDAVVAIFIQFASPSERETIFEGMKHAVRPGGLVVLQGYRPEQLQYASGGPPIADNLYTEALLREAFEGWDIEHLSVHDDIIEEGAGHSGMSALIDLVARRPA